MLVNDVVEIMLKINDAYNWGIQEGQKEFKEKLIELLISSLLSQNQQLIVLKAIEDAKG